MARALRLFEHPDFKTLLANTAVRERVVEAWVEKDYYLTEALRITTARYPSQTILKGGTSLSKGWSKLQRISDDIDFVLDVSAFTPSLNGKRVNEVLSTLAQAVGEHPGLVRDISREKVVGGKARHDYFDYQSALPSVVTGISPSVLLEAGVRSANWPTERRTITSLVGREAERLGQVDVAEDVAGFEMRVLDFRRTLVEKLFALDSLVRRFVQDGVPLGRNARHYADVYVLLGESSVQALLGTAEFQAMWTDQDAVGRQYYPKYESPPTRFRDSAALFPDSDLRQRLQEEYERDVAPLFFDAAYPPFEQVLERVSALRDQL